MWILFKSHGEQFYDKKPPDRKGGKLKDLMWVTPDFDASLPEEMLKLFYEDIKYCSDQQIWFCKDDKTR